MRLKAWPTGRVAICVAAGGAVSFVSALAGTSAAAPDSGSSSSDAPSGAAPPLLTQNQAIAAGVYTYEATTNPDGSITQTYKFANGLVAESQQPPPGFSPLNATNAELTQYGLPARPVGRDPGSMATWTQAMSAWRAAAPMSLAIQQASSKVPGDLAQDFESGVGDWGGYVDYSSTGDESAYTGAQSVFAAPNVGASCGGSNGGTTVIGVWTGLGGYGSDGALIQSGAEAGENLEGSQPQSVWQPFWELANAFSPQLLKGTNQSTAIAIQPGNTVWSKTTYSSSNGGTANFFIENETSGMSSSFSLTNNPLTGPISGYYYGDHADFVTEEPTVGPFSQFAMTQNEAETGGAWQAAGSLNNFATDPPQGWFNVGPWDSSHENFAVGWQHC